MRYVTFAFLIISTMFIAGCSSEQNTDETTLPVAAASSLSGTLSELKKAFESEHRDITLTLNYEASGKLSQQIRSGAPVDVFLTSDPKWMDRLAQEDAIVADTRIDFAQNSLVFVSSRNKSISASQLSDLPNMEVEQIAIGSPDSVSAGKYAKQAMTASGIWDNLEDRLIYTNNAQQTLTYIESGRAEFGIVCASDLTQSDLIKEIFPVDKALHEPIQYQAAVTSTSSTMEASKEFNQFLKTDKAQSILRENGFMD
ncbi:molybdate ABC transporter substrate-binding protein [Lentibacillus kapialis]|uniref:Molybdate ABC transporter substrate-binding protein n=1 Tax=Lentibacillus kapialis TaxID=340214 RepID=A0A917PRX2_9BACI|nr:molybdate ABC transporter substrate-binding protein [Lentibacillus kapialis]GGJ89690.1 molybdate ABC transporter substrate-binding protein [Lentibacillus kapialis]